MGIKSAPFKVDDETIDQLDGLLGERLFLEIDKFNALEQGKAMGSQTSAAPEGDKAWEHGAAGPSEDAGVLPAG